jgi:CubicO group peptidase (beta-lactamase class C family)
MIECKMDDKFAISLERKINKRVSENQFSGAVLVRRGRTDLFRRAYGFANRTWKIPNTPTTRFRIASVGKMFTAAAVMQLIEAEKFSLDTRVVEYLDLKGTKIHADATVYHMLTMTSGIADWDNEEAEDYEIQWEQFCRDHPLYLLRSDADYLPIFSQQEPYNAVAEKFRYNNAGFMLLGLMIEKAAGISYFDYIRQNIFARAGMKQSDFLDLDDVSPNVAEGYVPIKDESGAITKWRKNIYSTTAGGAADGGSTSTLDDLVRFSRALRNGKLCSPESVAAMLAPKADASNESDGWMYGFGCFLLRGGDSKIIRWGHTGAEDGVSCWLAYYPAQRLDVVILGNQTSGAGRLLRAIHETIY